MAGQTPMMMPLSDTLGAVMDAPPISVFDLSRIADGVVPLEGGLELVPIIHVIHPAWLFLYLFVLLGFFAWIRLYYGNILSISVQASINFKVASRMFQDNSQLQKQLDNILYALYLLSIAFLLFFVEERLGLSPYGFKGGTLYLFNLALFTGIFVGRVFLVNLTGMVFNHLKIFREYLYNSFIFNKLMGLALLPFMLFVVYTTGVLQEVILWMTLCTAILVVMMRLIRGIVFSFKKDISLFYMFLYLCALEIVPLALLYRYLEGIL